MIVLPQVVFLEKLHNERAANKSENGLWKSLRSILVINQIGLGPLIWFKNTFFFNLFPRASAYAAYAVSMSRYEWTCLVKIEDSCRASRSVVQPNVSQNPLYMHVYQLVDCLSRCLWSNYCLLKLISRKPWRYCTYGGIDYLFCRNYSYLPFPAGATSFYQRS